VRIKELLGALSGGMPRGPMFIGVPVLAFFVTIGVVMAVSGGNGDKTPAEPTLNVSLSQSLTVPTPTLVPPEPTATAVPDRTSCSEISGTAYRSDAERDWYLANCSGQAASSGGTTTTTTTTSSAPRSTGGGQFAMGDRLVISKIGLNAPVYSTVVGSDGVMVDPTGYFNAVWYDFRNIPGLGGYPTTGGNTVLAGHVDSAVYGRAVFYDLKNVAVGDTIEYYVSDGSYYRYVVSAIGDYLPSDNWAAIVASTAADMTIITCIGTFDTSVRQYSHRRVVFGTKA
jgi:LPXTG-site transpeptidase (sortase) family protein